MDEIQKVLCKLGRRDLAQKYYLKTARNMKIDKLCMILEELNIMF